MQILGLSTSRNFNPMTATPEELLNEARMLVVDSSCFVDSTGRRSAFDALCLADTLAAMATAAAMVQQHLCGHGIRGWCPFCARDIQDNKDVS